MPARRKRRHRPARDLGPHDGTHKRRRSRARRGHMAEVICDRLCSRFYFTKHTFDGVSIPARHHLESVAVFVENCAEIARSVDRKLGIAGQTSSVELGENPSCRLVRRRRKQTDINDLVRCRIDSAVQPVIVTVEADHLLVDRNSISGHRRDRLSIRLVHPLVNSNVTPFDSQNFEILTNIP